MSPFNYTAFYAERSIEAANALAAAAKTFAENPTGLNGAILRLAADSWKNADAVARTMECHDL